MFARKYVTKKRDLGLSRISRKVSKMCTRFRTTRMFLLCISLSLILIRVTCKIDSKRPTAELLEQDYEDDPEITSSVYPEPKHLIIGDNSSEFSELDPPNFSHSLEFDEIEKHKLKLQGIEEETDRLLRLIAELENRSPSIENEISDTNSGEIDKKNIRNLTTVDTISVNNRSLITGSPNPYLNGRNESKLQHKFHETENVRNFTILEFLRSVSPPMTVATIRPEVNGRESRRNESKVLKDTSELDINSIIDPLIAADSSNDDTDVKMVKGKPVHHKKENKTDDDYENRRDSTHMHKSVLRFGLSEYEDSEIQKHVEKLRVVEEKTNALQNWIAKLENTGSIVSDLNDLEEFDEMDEIPVTVTTPKNDPGIFEETGNREVSGVDANVSENNGFSNTKRLKAIPPAAPTNLGLVRNDDPGMKITEDVTENKTNKDAVDILPKVNDTNKSVMDYARPELLQRKTTAASLVPKRNWVKEKNTLQDLGVIGEIEPHEKREVKKPLHYFGHVEPFRLKLGRKIVDQDVTFGHTDTPFNLKPCPNSDFWNLKLKLEFKLTYVRSQQTIRGYIHAVLKSSAPLIKFAMQFVTNKGVYFGRLFEPDHSFKCGDPKEEHWNFEKNKIHNKVYEMPKRTNGTDKVTVTTFEFKSPKQELHFFWRFTPMEAEEIAEGFQIQTFNVFSTLPTCFVQGFTQLFKGDETPFEPVDSPSGEFDCHKDPVIIPDGSPSTPLTLHPGYRELVLKARWDFKHRRGFCPREKLFGKLLICDPPGKPDLLEFNIFRVSPETNGWVHIVVKVKDSNLGLYRFVMQAVTKAGFMAGKWLGKTKGCKGQSNKADIDMKPKSVAHFQVPKYPPLKRSPTMVGIEFASQRKEHRLFWKYNVDEAKEVSRGVQFHVFLQPFNYDCYLELFSPIYKLPMFTAETNITEAFKKQLPHSCTNSSLAVVSKDTTNILRVDPNYFKQCRMAGPIGGTAAILVKLPPTKAPGIPVKPPKKITDDEEPEDEEHKDYVNVKFNRAQSDAEKVVFNKRAFYDGCGENKGCFGDPMGCIQTRTCTAAVSYRRKTDRCLFEVMGETGKYIAMGLSRDRFMDADSVVECVRESNNIRVYSSMNLSNKKHFRMRNHSSLSFLKGSYEGGLLYCEFEKLRITTFKTLTFDLAAEKFYILLARGDTGRDGPRGDIYYHSKGQVSSPEKYILMEQFGKSLMEIILQNFHAISFILTWLFLIPTSTFMVRYFKETYVDKFICSYSIWFGIHFQMMIVSVILTILGFASIGAAKGEMPGKSPKFWRGFHRIGGVILLLIILLQMTIGIVISWVKRELKWLHHIHCVLGHLEFIFGVVIIYRSKDLRFGLPCATSGVIIAYCVAYAVVHAIMSYQVCYVDFVQGALISRVYTSPGLRPCRITERESEAPGGIARKTMLYVFIIVQLLISGIIIYMHLADYKDCEELRLIEALEVPEYDD